MTGASGQGDVDANYDAVPADVGQGRDYTTDASGRGRGERTKERRYSEYWTQLAASLPGATGRPGKS